MAHGDFKNLARRTVYDKVLIDKAFNIEKVLNMTDMKGGWLLLFTKFLKKCPLQAVMLLIMRLNKICN